jgi:hypothetical protein
MSLKAWRVAAVLLVGGTTVAIAAAPPAGASGADAVIANLQSEGYDVQINWVNGFDTQQLSDCTVTGVDNPDHSGAAPKPGDTVYVNVTCPNPDEGGFGFGAGIG